MCHMPTKSQHKHVFPLTGNHPSKWVTLHVVTKPARCGNTFTASLYMIYWHDHVQIIHPTHTFISQMYLFTVIQPYPPSTLSHGYTSHALHTEISSHVLSTCLTDPFMHVILSQPPTSLRNPAVQPHLQTPQSMLCIDSRNALHHLHCTNPLPLTKMIKYHCFQHISLLPKRGYY